MGLQLLQRKLFEGDVPWLEGMSGCTAFLCRTGQALAAQQVTRRCWEILADLREAAGDRCHHKDMPLETQKCLRLAVCDAEPARCAGTEESGSPEPYRLRR